MKIDKDSYVTISYLIKLGPSEFFPENGQPEDISFCMGWGAMPPGLEEALLNLEVNDAKQVRLAPNQAYGDLDPELIREIPRSEFDPQVELKPGLVFETEDEEGHQLYFMVQEVGPEKVVVDFNHPLAGRELEISFTVRQVRQASKEELQGACACPDCGGGPSQH